MFGVGRNRNIHREAIALAFRSTATDETQVSFVLDGEISDEHGAAFATAQRRSQRRVLPATWHSAEELFRDALASDVLRSMADPAESNRLIRDRADQEAGTRRAIERDIEDTGGQGDGSTAALEEANRRIAALEAELAGYSVRQVPVWEHRAYLDRALDEATERIMIISPWIRADVVNAALLKRLTAALRRDVNVFIGYGIGEDRPNGRHPKQIERDKKAKGRLEQLARDHEGFTLAELGDTHAKVLICDARFMIITSFNWLSFKGDVDMKFRDERGVYVALPDQIDGLFAEYQPRFA